jgi:hypothetical protein
MGNPLRGTVFRYCCSMGCLKRVKLERNYKFRSAQWVVYQVLFLGRFAQPRIAMGVSEVSECHILMGNPYVILHLQFIESLLSGKTC